MITKEIVPLIKEDLNTTTYQPSPYNLNRERDMLSNVLNKMFPENRTEDKELLKVKQILGEKAAEFTPEQMKELMSKIQYLIESWLNDYERKIFNGQTLYELLSSKQI